MQTIPLQVAPSQFLTVSLSGQDVQIALYQKPEGLFVDITSNGVDLVIAVLAHNGVPLVCREYLGFLGNLMFIDTQGTSDPTYDGFNGRYELIYMDRTEYVP